MQVSLDTTQVDRWIENQSNRDRAMKLSALLGANQAANNLKNRAISTSTSGYAYNTTRGLVEKRADGYVGTVVGPMYAIAAWETGRRPGAMPPMNSLKRWARLKLGDENLAYAVAKTIAQRGTKKHRFKNPKYITQTIEWVARILFPKLLPKLLDDFTR